MRGAKAGRGELFFLLLPWRTAQPSAQKLDKEEKEIFLWELASSERLYAEAEEICPQRNAYNSIIKLMTERFDNSIKNNNYLMIFDLEEIAQEHDAEYHFAEKGKSKKSYSTLLEMKTRFLEFAENPEKIKNRFGKEIENLKSENAFYSIRASAIKMIQDEHQRNIDIALGYVKRK